DIQHHVKYIECPFTAWTFIRQLFGDHDSSYESDASSENLLYVDDTETVTNPPPPFDTSYLLEDISLVHVATLDFE
ncbi:hypothetical protein KI387_005563, partial [Taxus chinensis]